MIRRSAAQLLGDAGTPHGWPNHRRAPEGMVPADRIDLQRVRSQVDNVTDLYAAFDPNHLSQTTAAIERIVGSIKMAVRALSRAAPKSGTIIPVAATKKAH